MADEDLLKQWLPVDIYVGGAEHAVLHLLYARFWHKFLYDIGVVPTKEPFQKLFNQGMILGTSYRDHRGALVATDKVEKRDGSFFHVETGEELEQAPAKMSKSLKNVVNPDDVVEQYGADTPVSYTHLDVYKRQGLLAIEAGADYLAPYYNRMENLNIDSAQVISQLASAIERNHSSSKILAASFKNVAQVNRAFKEGTQAITAGADVFEAAFGMPSIAKAVDDFEADWSAVHHKNTI